MHGAQNKNCSLVVATSGGGDFLADYYAAIVREQAHDRVSVIVIPDGSAPRELYERCGEFARRGMRVHCPTPAEQECYRARRDLSSAAPQGLEQRRALGLLMALEGGCDFVISIGDDNYCRPGENYFAEHGVVSGPHVTAACVNTSERFFNSCDLLEVVPTRVYARGFPYRRRNKPTRVTRGVETGAVRINSGLWLHEPDLDGMTWLVTPVRATRLKSEPVLLGENAWAPLGAANTALHRDVLPAYCFGRTGAGFAGMAGEGPADILGGYFAQACVRHMGHRVRVGGPCTDRRRARRQYLEDATREMGGVWLLEDLTEWLADLKLQGSTYAEAHLALADALDDSAERFTGFVWTDATRAYLHQLAYDMRRWTRACETASGAACGFATMPAVAQQALEPGRLAAA